MRRWVLVTVGVALAAGLASARPKPPALPTLTPAATVALPGGKPGIGFDDLRYSTTLGKLMVPAGRSGRLDLIDPGTREVTSIEGFSAAGKFGGGHGEGITSVDEGAGFLFVIDRSAKKLDVVAPGSKKIVAQAELASGPDYVRWVEATSEVWVTEPGEARIEIFSVPTGGAPEHAAFIAVAGGPESLLIDNQRGRAYTHLWTDQTLAIDLKQRAIVAQWPNGCKDSRGIALDEARGLLFVACEEGKVTALDLEADGKQVGKAKTGTGVDIIDYNPELGHVYVAGAHAGSFDIVGVGAKGTLKLLATGSAAKGTHCVVADDKGAAWVCDPKHGRLLVFTDKLPRGGD
jgi:DNA-binding beta-propeller fold protein YncE